MRKLAYFVMCLSCWMLLGCADGIGNPSEGSKPVSIAASNVRRARRAYDGAPPVIPHPPLGANCVQCHTERGSERPPLGMAPANPHRLTPGIGMTANCRQCHVFQRDTTAVATSFAGLQKSNVHGDRLYATAPPVIPHAIFMREDCAACHTGPAARPEIRCSHPERANCRQCHVQSATNRALTSDTGVGGKAPLANLGFPYSR